MDQYTHPANMVLSQNSTLLSPISNDSRSPRSEHYDREDLFSQESQCFDSLSVNRETHLIGQSFPYDESSQSSTSSQCGGNYRTRNSQQQTRSEHTQNSSQEFNLFLSSQSRSANLNECLRNLDLIPLNPLINYAEGNLQSQEFYKNCRSQELISQRNQLSSQLGETNSQRSQLFKEDKRLNLSLPSSQLTNYISEPDDIYTPVSAISQSQDFSQLSQPNSQPKDEFGFIASTTNLQATQTFGQLQTHQPLFEKNLKLMLKQKEETEMPSDNELLFNEEEDDDEEEDEIGKGRGKEENFLNEDSNDTLVGDDIYQSKFKDFGNDEIANVPFKAKRKIESPDQGRCKFGRLSEDSKEDVESLSQKLESMSTDKHDDSIFVLPSAAIAAPSPSLNTFTSRPLSAKRMTPFEIALQKANTPNEVFFNQTPKKTQSKKRSASTRKKKPVPIKLQPYGLPVEITIPKNSPAKASLSSSSASCSKAFSFKSPPASKRSDLKPPPSKEILDKRERNKISARDYRIREAQKKEAVKEGLRVGEKRLKDAKFKLQTFAIQIDNFQNSIANEIHRGYRKYELEPEFEKEVKEIIAQLPPNEEEEDE